MIDNLFEGTHGLLPLKQYSQVALQKSLDSIMARLSKIEKDDPEYSRATILCDSVSSILYQLIEHRYPIGKLCRVRDWPQYNHIIIGHIHHYYEGKKSLIQIQEINPRHANQTYSNWDMVDIHVKPEDAK